MTPINTPKRKDIQSLRVFIRNERLRLVATILIIVGGFAFLRYINTNYEDNFTNSFQKLDQKMVEY